MNVYVVNLDKDRERLRSVSGQCAEIGLSFERVAGVYGRGLSEAERARSYRPQKALRTRCRELTPAEIGCALSHISIYRKMLADDVPVALVLEDDVRLNAALPPILSALERDVLCSAPSVVLLSPAAGKPSGHKPLAGEHVLAPYRAGFYTHAYVVTQAGARALLKELFPVGDVADCWRRLARHRVVDVYTVQPPVVLQDQEEHGSSTTDDLLLQRAKRGTLAKLAFKMRRAFWLSLDVAQALYDRAFSPYAGTQAKR